MKFLRNLLILILLLLVGLFIFVFSFLDNIAYAVAPEDLPQDVYENSGDLLGLVRSDVLDMLVNEDDKYTLTEEVVNLILLDTIRKNINTEYDPLGTCETNECGRIIDEEYFYVDYAYAELNDDNQLVITISFGANKYIDNRSALILVFDIDFNLEFDHTLLEIQLNPSLLTDMNIMFTLASYSLGEKDMSLNLLNYIFDRMNKDSIEENMTFGTLDLDEYTYSISILDAFEIG